MAFSESLKLEVKKRAHFTCCLCRVPALPIEVHHIVPQSDSGPDAEDNAVPLCSTCHETYGGNPTKRKFIRENRDFWYDVCAKRYAGDTDRLHEISATLATMEAKTGQFATKTDLNKIAEQLTALVQHVLQPSGYTDLQKAAALSSAAGTIVASGVVSSDAYIAHHTCPKCSALVARHLWDHGYCSNCGSPF